MRSKSQRMVGSQSMRKILLNKEVLGEISIKIPLKIEQPASKGEGTVTAAQLTKRECPTTT